MSTKLTTITKSLRVQELFTAESAEGAEIVYGSYSAASAISAVKGFWRPFDRDPAS